MTTATCGQCQRMEADPNSVCTLPQCLGCGRCYCYLTGSKCQSCKESNDPQHTPALAPPPNLPLTFTAPAFASMTKTPLTVLSIPQELFQGGLIWKANCWSAKGYSDWFFSLGWDVYAYYLQEAKDLAFPSKTQQQDNKICPLASDFSSTCCIIADNGVSVTQESMKSTLLKTKKLDKTKFGLIFNMKKHLATLLSESSPEPEKSCSQTQKRKKFELSSDEAALDDSECDSKSYSRTQKHCCEEETETIHVECSSTQVQHLQNPLLPGRDEIADGPKLEHDETMSLESFGNMHGLAPSAKEILLYPVLECMLLCAHVTVPVQPCIGV
ncbi:hypothetical protein DFH28DRAFT_923418 [Melampsora americana]|nr:hypothetical protein DFH28DRAFT_923418 [Melampsora americana]